MPYIIQGIVREKEGNSTVRREHDNPNNLRMLDGRVSLVDPFDKGNYNKL